MIDRANVLLVTLFVDGFATVRDRLRREEGQAFVEYAMVLLIVAVAIGAGVFVTPFQQAITGAFNKISQVITTATGG